MNGEILSLFRLREHRHFVWREPFLICCLLCTTRADELEQNARYAGRWSRDLIVLPLSKDLKLKRHVWAELRLPRAYDGLRTWVKNLRRLAGFSFLQRWIGWLAPWIKRLNKHRAGQILFPKSSLGVPMIWYRGRYNIELAVACHWMIRYGVKCFDSIRDLGHELPKQAKLEDMSFPFAHIFLWAQFLDLSGSSPYTIQQGIKRRPLEWYTFVLVKFALK